MNEESYCPICLEDVEPSEMVRRPFSDSDEKICEQCFFEILEDLNEED